MSSPHPVLDDPGEVPDALTPCTVQELYAALTDAWTERFKAPPSRASMLVLIAQWAEETGWGKSMHCYNIGNAKHVHGDGRAWCTFPCTERLEGVVVKLDPPDVGCRFRAYPSLAAGAGDYLVSLTERFAGAWPAVLAGDVRRFAAEFAREDYYTAKEELYEAALVQIDAQIDRELATAAGSVVATTAPHMPGTVADVQRALNALGARPRLEADGEMGPLTHAAIRTFQREHELEVDGIAGPLTLAALAQASAWAARRGEFT